MLMKWALKHHYFKMLREIHLIHILNYQMDAFVAQPSNELILIRG